MENIDFVFLDSGTGGIPYMLALKEKLPSASCVYVGDTKNFPYGEKTPEEVSKCASSASELIIKNWNPKVLVIACNTISVTALKSLRENFPNLPIVGTVPAIKLARKITQNKKIGFLATNGTVNNPYSQKLICDFASDCEVFKRGDPNLVDFIENKFFTSTEAEKENAVRPAVEFFSKYDCDVIILACTHFTHIAKTMQNVAGQNIKVIDSREGVCNQALRVFEEGKNNKLPNDSSKNSIPKFFVTSATENQIIEYEILCKNCGLDFEGVVR